jgi:hypothetical protein
MAMSYRIWTSRRYWAPNRSLANIIGATLACAVSSTNQTTRPAGTAQQMTRRGATQSMTADVLSTEKKCFRRRYHDELDSGAIQADIAVPNNLFRIATREGSGAVTAAICWLKTRTEWREVGRGVKIKIPQRFGGAGLGDGGKNLSKGGAH